VRERCVLAPGTILTGSTPVYDLVRDQVYRRDGDRPLEIPAGAVVVAGRAGRTGRGGPRGGGSPSTAPVIVKYRDEKTDAADSARGVPAMKQQRVAVTGLGKIGKHPAPGVAQGGSPAGERSRHGAAPGAGAGAWERARRAPWERTIARRHAGRT